MELDPGFVLKYIKAGRYANEVKSYWKSVKKLPRYDNSRFYHACPTELNTITQGDVITGLPFVNLPSTKVQRGRAIIISSTCDIELENERKFATRIMYASLFNLRVYEEEMRNEKNTEGNKKFEDTFITEHIQAIKDQKVGQILYLPKGMELEEDALVYFDRAISYPNNAVSREDLDKKRLTSFSLYGWHTFMERMALFFFRPTDETVELRLKPTVE